MFACQVCCSQFSGPVHARCFFLRGWVLHFLANYSDGSIWISYSAQHWDIGGAQISFQSARQTQFFMDSKISSAEGMHNPGNVHLKLDVIAIRHK